MALAAVPFLLSWLLKEVPLRTTVAGVQPSPPTAQEVAATDDERASAGAGAGRESTMSGYAIVNL